jgi:hypothetical protein
MPTLILYACPTGPLADQLDTYFEKSQTLIGPNKAHDYMPHCTLTGFFEDDSAAIPLYITALTTALACHQDSQPDPVITVNRLTFAAKWHGLALQSPWLQQFVHTFARQAQSPTRSTPLRLKDWLHLSLAYGFAPDQHQPLQRLAEQLITLESPVQWELRFYQRHPDNQWTCHLVSHL